MSSPDPDGRYRHPGSCGAALLLLCTLIAGPALALPDDQDQPIHITADKAVRDEKQGFTVYSGSVQMNQGSMEIKADKLTIYHVDEDADKIVAEGEPAKMWQQPELDKGVVHARALVIEYFRDEQRVHLETNAHVDQEGSIVTGDSIDYFITEQLIKGLRFKAELLRNNHTAAGVEPLINLLHQCRSLSQRHKLQGKVHHH